MKRRTPCSVALLALVVSASTVAGCDSSNPPPRSSWAPEPVRSAGLTVVAESDDHGFRLHTAGGDRTFLGGVNVGSTTPTFQPGQVAVTGEDSRRWLEAIGGLGIPVVRLYTILPPSFYGALLDYNTRHPDAPIYLAQGVYPPDESYLEAGATLYDESVDASFTRELLDASAAVHGDLTRPPTPGRASGTWAADVSPWVAAWIAGLEWDPVAVARTDDVEAAAPYTPGTYFAATPGATATERWIARHLDALASAEADRGTSAPIAFANWPTADPLTHPEEPLESEDLVSIDAEHVLPTDDWPAGTFASFHLYPYYPDFQRYEPGLQVEVDGRIDPYAGYLRALREHFTSMPLVVTEVGVPSSLGSAHVGPLGRDQGGHSEQEQARINAGLLQAVKDEGASGAFLFSWTDEWFKQTWNTTAHQVPERRQLWHDPLTNEQWFGLVATDPDRVRGAAKEMTPSSGPWEHILIDADPSYVYLDLTSRGDLPEEITIDVDMFGADQRADVRIISRPASGSSDLFIRAELDPLRLDQAAEVPIPDRDAPWHLYRLLLNRAYSVSGEPRTEELQDVGHLVEGQWDPTADDYTSTATWRVHDRDTIAFRIPWSMLSVADPSSRTALGPGLPAKLLPISEVTWTIATSGGSVIVPWTWRSWQNVSYRERLKAGAADVASLLAGLSG